MGKRGNMALRQSRALPLALLLVGSALNARSASAGSKSVVPVEWYGQMLETAIASYRKNATDIYRADVESAATRRRYRFADVGLRTPSLDRASTASAIELASVAIRTSLDGVDAGVSIAPAALLGAADSPHQATISLAALDENKARYALGYNYQTMWSPMTPADLGLPQCSLTENSIKKLHKAIDSLQLAYETTCEAVVDWVQSAPSKPDDLATHEALNACTHADPETTVALDDATRQIKTYLDRERAEARKDPKRWQEFLSIVGARDAEIQRVVAFKLPPVDCFQEDEIKAALANTAWHAPRYRIGASITLDQFANVWGFNPDPDQPLPNGQVARWEGRVDAARLTGFAEVHIGLGLGRSRSEFNDDLATYVAPSFSVSVVLASLSGERLYHGDQLNSLDGKPPPRLVLGVDGEMQYALQLPDYQSTHFSDVKATLFLDFIFTDELGFRLGVPVRGGLVTREADATAMPPVTKLSDLQWSMPVLITTVLKM